MSVQFNSNINTYKQENTCYVLEVLEIDRADGDFDVSTITPGSEFRTEFI